MGEVISIKSGEALFSEYELFEGMHPEQIRQFIADTNDRVEELHRIKQVAIDVLEGYGYDRTTVDEPDQGAVGGGEHPKDIS